MSAQIAPTIPPRPTRAQQAAGAQGASRLPEMPPRPINKRLERSVSPGNFPRSPLNEPWSGNISRQKTNEQVDALPRRPSVQNLPSIGQEGMEYADIMNMQTNLQPPSSSIAADAAAQTRNIAQDLKLHAPKPSLPKSSATAQVQAVTRTDSSQAAHLGFGKPATPSQDEGEGLQRIRTRTSFSRPSSTVDGERRPSMHSEETGPAEIGIRVPINPLLGDVQAPSPGPGMSPSNTGTNGDRRRSVHSRSRSAVDMLPPGSYGLHGHGLLPQDQFEKEWYAKHPEAAQNEETSGHGVYESIGSGRGSFALSSDDLNKIVRQTASRGAGFGTSTYSSVPDEQIAYGATDVYASRSQANTPNSLAKTLTNSSQPVAESPLRKTSFPADGTIPAQVRRTGRLSASRGSDDHDAVESESEHEVSIQPSRRFNKVTGGQETMNETVDAKPYVTHADAEGDYVNEHGYTVPILAADEVAHSAGHEHLQPAVNPRAERRESVYEEAYRSGDATPSSRPSSRPSSVYGLHSASNTLSRFVSRHDDEREHLHTPLEDVEEYEPLFPEDDDKAPLSHAERFKQRPNSLRQRFPSQDIWEDTPSSHYHSAEVSTPDLPAQVEKPATKTFETPEQEAARKEEPSEEERKKLIPREERLAKSRFAPHLRDDMPTRPGLTPRFPSSDIWEDSPDSHQLVTTVSTPQEDNEPDSPVDVPVKPFVPPRPAGKSRLGEGASTAQVAPSIPARPQKGGIEKEGTTSPTELKKVPSIPDKPKPQVPARPGKKAPGETLSKTISGDSAGPSEHEKTSPPVAKVKPQIPARPAAGSKIANLRGNFMNDLNQKLGLGPPKEKEPEPVVEEAKPLEDARKGRARGPQRRAPAKSPAAPAKSSGSAISSLRSLWTIDDEDELNIGSSAAPEATSELEDAPAAVGLSDDKAAQIENSTPADAPLPKIIQTSDHASTEAAAFAEDVAEPTLGTPGEEKSNPLSHQPSGEEVEQLSKETTASSGQASGPELEREEPNPDTDAIPASQQTTASTHEESSLEKMPKREAAPIEEPRSTKLPEGEPGQASAQEV
ncbi:altered inheritance of mitochondria protein 21 [Exophiala viscosa]|uniref:Altered inheritance of mitochondria protein 21 n=1 Tax=Exophiala viscosa TaxID=2486360 RepID=A0AAN6E3N7_9EURO|nr:altered inheritance of mitochondria protein 21 [Exophiala viscosa]